MRMGREMIAVLLALAVIVPSVGLAAPSPLWTERRGTTAAPEAPAMVWTEIAAAVKPAVVNVNTTLTTEARTGSPGAPDVTNHRVVDGAAEIRVTLGDGREFTAKPVGGDAKTDLALLKIEASGLPVVPLGASAQLRVGEP